MNRLRSALAAAAVALAVVAVPAAPAVAAGVGPVHASSPTDARASGSGHERMCVGVDDPEGVGTSTTWVCSPEAQWYADMIAFVLSLKPV